MAFDITAHALLSGDSKGLVNKDPTAFDEQVALATELLGLADQTFSTDETIRLERAVVLQVNWMLKLGLEPYYIKDIRSNQSAQGKTYRDLGLLNPMAEAIVATILPQTDVDWFDDARSLR